MAKKAKKKGRGGTRAGAGRPPLTDDESLRRLRIGARCEQLHREAMKANAKTKVSEQSTHVRRQLVKFKDLPRNERKALAAAILLDMHGELDSDAVTDYRDDVRAALQQDQGIDLVNDDHDPIRLVSVAAKRPKGKRADIVAQVANETGEAEKAVTECWRDFRAVQAAIESDND